MKLSSTSSFRTFLCLTLLCFTGLPAPALGQTPARQTQTDSGDVVRIDTDLVQTDVMIFDRQGRFVDGLEREQFELQIDDKPVPISFFERVGNMTAGRAKAPRTSVTAGGAKPQATSVERTPTRSSIRGQKIVFFVDDLHLAALSIEPVRKGLLQFIANDMQLKDQVAIVSASGQIGFLQQFTDHPAVLRAAVARLKVRPSHIVDTEDASTMSEYVAYRVAQGDRETISFYVNDLMRSLSFNYATPKVARGGGCCKGGSDPIQAERLLVRRAQAMIAQSISNSTAALSALEDFLRASGSVPERKTVFYISDGFLVHEGNGELRHKLQRITDAAARANVVIYAVDAQSFTGLHQATQMKLDSLGRPDRFSIGETRSFQTALNTISEDTGGRSLLGAKALKPALDDALQESGNYYRVAWRPDKEGYKIQRFRSLKISVVDHPELTVRLARGYLTEDSRAAARQKDQRASNLKVISKTVDNHLETVSPNSRPTLPTQLALSFLNTPNNGMVLTASTQIAIDNQGFGESDKAEIDLAGVVLNDQGKLASSFQTKLNIDSPPAAAIPADDANVIYNYRAPLAPGIYQVRVAARHQLSGRLGYATQWVEIPNPTSQGLLLSTLLLDSRLVETRTSGHAEQTEQIQHSVDRRFKATSRLGFLLFIYNAARGPETNRAPELTADIRVVHEGRTLRTFPQVKVLTGGTTDLQRIPYAASFPLESLPSGKHLLQITITDQVNKTKAMQQVDFEVE